MNRIILQNSSTQLKLNLSQGGQIEELLLKHPTSEKLISVILPFNEKENFFLSGNFIMFPWVNRLESNILEISENQTLIEPLKIDSVNHPIHGLYFNIERKLIQLENKSVKIEPISFNDTFPSFTETYYLEEQSLRIRTEFFNHTNKIQKFSYGYHPYLRLTSNIDNYFIKTNLSQFIPLTNELLPNPNLSKNNITEIFSQNKMIEKLELDHLFTTSKENAFFGIFDRIENLILQVRVSPNSEIQLPYFQVYTPPNRKSIAIEPMSSTGNAFFIPNSGIYSLLPNDKIFGEFFIELK